MTTGTAVSRTPTVRAIAEALATAVGTVPGINVTAYLDDKFTAPAAMVRFDKITTYHGAFANGDVEHAFTVLVIVGRADVRSAIEAMEDYASQKGNPSSVQGAIESDPTLGGVVSSCIVEGTGDPAELTVGSAIYLTVTFHVTVHA